MAVLPLLYVYASPPVSPHRIEGEGNECRPAWIEGQIGQLACQWQNGWLSPYGACTRNSIAMHRPSGGSANEEAGVEPRIAAALSRLSAVVDSSGVQRARRLGGQA